MCGMRDVGFCASVPAQSHGSQGLLTMCFEDAGPCI